jgi:AcrR family transcriptional regulator
MEAVAEVQRGRPRDEGIDRRVIEAACELLAESGFAETTIQAIARRAGVGPSAIYRRWPSRIELIEQAVFPAFDDLRVTPTGDIRVDLESYVTAIDRAYNAPAARAAIPGLLSAYQSNPRAYRRDPFPVAASLRRDFRHMFELAAAGTVDPAVDPEDVLDLLIGSMLYRTFQLPFTARAGHADQTVELLHRAIRPTGPQ